MEPGLDLTVVWAAIIAFAVFAYVVMDGFDLGIGVLFLGFKEGDERDQAMNAIAPFWDGNETWLVFGGGGLLAAFPLAYATILPATYPLMIAMLLGLIFRGVAFEFRWRETRHRRILDIAFAAGSIVATASQGVIVGAITQGIRVSSGAYIGGWLDWLSPFSLLTGCALVVGYALLGSTWLIWKTDGAVQRKARRIAFPLGAATLVALAAISIATPLLAYDYWKRWFSLPAVFLTSQVPLSVLAVAIVFVWSLRRGAERIPFFSALAVFLLTFTGLGISLYPYVVPRSLTIWDAASPPESQKFMLYGALIIVPTILAYTSWAYWVFRGKVGDGYHHD
jgi:cytochrome d ubiquinol oxidase subunit II